MNGSNSRYEFTVLLYARFFQTFLWYEKVHISQLVCIDLSMGKLNIGSILHPLEERGLLQVVDDPTSAYPDDGILTGTIEELFRKPTGALSRERRDVSELLTVIDLGIPVFEKKNPHFPKSPNIHTRLREALDNAPLLKTESVKLRSFKFPFSDYYPKVRRRREYLIQTLILDVISQNRRHDANS